jgi:site-specific DNA-adenine methylase
MKNYLGAKSASGTPQAVINLMPPHDTYIEPFLGTGAILSRKAPALTSYGVDKNKRCVDGFNCAAAGGIIHLIWGDAFEFLLNFDFENAGQVLVYLDPPYINETRTGNKRYEFDFTDDDHHRLLALVKQLPCHVILSGYDNSLYNDELTGWFTTKWRAMTRGGARWEKVWCNFEPGEIHYHSYAGKDRTDRQRIKRKAERMVNKIRAMPPAERQAVVAAILASQLE